MLRDLRTVGDIRPMPFNSCTEGFGEVPQELTHERKNECFSFNAILDENTKYLNLYAHRLTRKIMQLQPPIHTNM